MDIVASNIDKGTSWIDIETSVALKNVINNLRCDKNLRRAFGIASNSCSCTWYALFQMTDSLLD